MQHDTDTARPINLNAELAMWWQRRGAALLAWQRDHGMTVVCLSGDVEAVAITAAGMRADVVEVGA